MQLPDRRRLPLPLAAALLALALLQSLAAPQARATVTPIDTGALDWGVKQSFRAYITGPIAHGTIQLGGGATQNPDGGFHFPLSGGSFDDESSATIVSFDGTVRFSGHDGALDMLLSDLRVELSSDGSRLLADVVSQPLSGGGASTYPDIGLVDLDLDGVDPLVDAGSTAWTGIPSVLSGTGAPAFGGFYTAGTAFDAVSFSYAGPGGRPIAEVWSEPGAPFFDATATATPTGGFSDLVVDAANGVIHAVTSSGVRAYDLDTLAPAGEEAVDLDQFGTAFDPETGTVFARAATPGNVLSFRYDDGAYVSGEVPMAATRTLDYDPAADKLYALGTSAPAPTFSGNPTVEVATRAGDGWDVETYPALETGERNVGGVVRSSTGALIASYAAKLVSGQVERQASAVLVDDGDELVATDIPNTVASAPASGASTGYGTPTAGLDGQVLLRETVFGAPNARVLTLEPSDANPSGYAVAGEPLNVAASAKALATDGEDGSLYVVEEDEVVVYREGTPVASVEHAGSVRVVGGASEVYSGSNGDGSVKLFRQLGNAPAVTEQPTGETVELQGDTGTAQVTFSAAADGPPAPTLQWQRRGPGETSWTDVDGETAGTLTVTATTALAGTRYRAVFENLAGAIASQPATLAVTVVPPAVDPPGEQPPQPDPPKGDPPRTDPPATPKPKAPLLDASRKRALVSGKGVATLATLRCRTGPCRVAAPRRVRFTLAGKRYRATVLAPATLKAGKRARVRLRLSRVATEALEGRKATVRLRVTIRSGAQRTSKLLRVTLRRP